MQFFVKLNDSRTNKYPYARGTEFWRILLDFSIFGSKMRKNENKIPFTGGLSIRLLMMEEGNERARHMIFMRSFRGNKPDWKIIFGCELSDKFPFSHCSKYIIVLSFCGKRISHSHNEFNVAIWRERCRMSRSPLHFREGRDEDIVDVLSSGKLTVSFPSDLLCEFFV